MRHTPFKIMALTSAVALGVLFSSNSFAQTETVNATLTTSSAITTTDTSDMDFGTWLVQIGTTDDTENDVTITLSNDGSATSVAGGSTDSQVVQITAPATEGVVNVQTPAPSILTMTRSGTSDFADASLGLTSVSYRTATEGPNALNADAATGTVTVTAAATDEPVRFGGVITFQSTPPDQTHTASFDVTFSY